MVQSSHVVVRTAQLSDADAIVQVYRENIAKAPVTNRNDIGPGMWREPETDEPAQALAENIGAKNREVWVAEHEGTIVGFLSAVVRTASTVHLTHVAVVNEIMIAPQMRGKGISNRLLAAFDMWAEEHACDLVVSISGNHDRERNRFFTKLGFAQVGQARAIPTQVLRSKLTGKGTVSRDTSRVIALRRALRHRQAKTESPT